MATNRVRFDAVRSIAFASITSDYVELGSVFGHKMRVLQFINNTDGDMMISFNGTADNVPVLANSFALYDLTSDQDRDESLRYEKNTQLYIKYISAPTTGTFYATTIYTQGE